MRAFTRLTAVAAALPEADIDTDRIIPARFVDRRPQDGLADCLFHDERFDGAGQERADFALNRPAWRDAGILVAGANFGCGSSREHAIFALLDYGIRAVLSPGASEIFANNAFENGLLMVTLPPDTVARLLTLLQARPGHRLTVDLERQVVADSDGTEAPFAIDPRRRRCLLEGLDTLSLTLRMTDRIAAFEARHPG
ncbi:3-isopropylmalate/(R)-2-methylmalate dehydratase small subunit [Stella humosa]|uniref:3-isopropylmalate dehydratase n=1 Tax=Stella humosa TaxID=94 RepID=A0A3N1KXT0_9PROT|nr:3-isopropylmalate dehydratase small subunit [Stella humosa]ROP83108.1 3-isopropylmalate/(R)-2-methylmalate dehydratase small subunit [Stella humosa]BBK30115.1 3-isopropylmalate dehydratase small subunit [Stella humosa]